MAVDESIRQSIQTAKRVCFFANYHQDAIIADHVIFYLTAIKNAGFLIVLVSTSLLPPSEIEKLSGICVQVILRENEGLDFGSWITAVERFFPLGAELLLLANDSVYAPVGDLAGYIDRLCSIEADFYGAVESGELDNHLQSWFILLRPKAYTSTAFSNLMKFPMMATATKFDLIKAYEIGLTQRLIKDNLQYHASFSSRHLTGFASRYSFNYSHVLWKELVQDGIPFIKIELVRQNPVRVTNVSQVRKVVHDAEPHLVSLIETDLARRGRLPMKRWIEMTDSPPLYWPEVRFLLHRKGSRLQRLTRLDSAFEKLLFKLITASTGPVRRFTQRLDRKLRKLLGQLQ